MDKLVYEERSGILLHVLDLYVIHQYVGYENNRRDNPVAPVRDKKICHGSMDETMQQLVNVLSFCLALFAITYFVALKEEVGKDMSE